MGVLVDEMEVGRLSKVRASTVDPVLIEAVEQALTTALALIRREQGEAAEVEGRRTKEFLLDPADDEVLDRTNWRSTVRAILEKTVPAGIAEELPSVATRLIGKDQDLFDQYDRLRGEAEFRMSLVPPLAALALTLALVVSPWISVVVAFLGLGALPLIPATVILASAPGAILRPNKPPSSSEMPWVGLARMGFVALGAMVGLAAAVGIGALTFLDQHVADVLRAAGVLAVFLGLAYAIFAQATKIQREAGDLLADAIFVGRVQSPLLERLLRTVASPSPAERAG